MREATKISQLKDRLDFFFGGCLVCIEVVEVELV